MKRRTFVGILAGIAAVVVAPIRKLWARWRPAPFVWLTPAKAAVFVSWEWEGELFGEWTPERDVLLAPDPRSVHEHQPKPGTPGHRENVEWRRKASLAMAESQGTFARVQEDTERIARRRPAGRNDEGSRSGPLNPSIVRGLNKGPVGSLYPTAQRTLRLTMPDGTEKRSRWPVL